MLRALTMHRYTASQLKGMGLTSVQKFCTYAKSEPQGSPRIGNGEIGSIQAQSIDVA